MDNLLFRQMPVALNVSRVHSASFRVHVPFYSISCWVDYVMKLKQFIESKGFETFIIVLIMINAVTLGLETEKRIMDAAGPALIMIDRIILTAFALEVLAKLWVYRLAFFKNPWRIFDFLVVSISLIPATDNLSVLRALRVLRVLRLVSAFPSLRKVVGGLAAALPGMGSIMMLMLLVFYVFSVMATKLYGGLFPDWFGSLGASAYSLFQIMTLESWSMGIVRPVMADFPHAWIFFVAFILCTSFTVLNLFIGIIVSAMQAEHEGHATEEREELLSKQNEIIEELRSLRQSLKSRSA